ncbi:MAG: hypothetical protein ACKVWV_15395 [Planctomycetota bacterium]
MSRALFALCAALALGAQDVPAPQRDGALPVMPPAIPPEAARDAAQAENEPAAVADEHETRLAELVARDPERWTRRELARTLAGSPVSLVTWNAARETTSRPTVLVCADGADERASLDVLTALVARSASDGASADAWTSATVCFLASRDGDRALVSAADYPEGWLPWTASAPYPLADPETRALAQLLVERREIATLVRLVPSRELARTAEPPQPGTLALFAASHAGLRTVAVDAARTSEAVDAIVGAARALPRLSVATSHVERLRPNLWLVDVPLANVGLSATAPDAGERWSALRVRMEAGGARVVSAALGRGNGVFRALPTGGPQLLGQLAAGEVVTVRWIVEAEEHAEFSLAFDAPRAGTVTVSVPLQ